ncbi:hypothetical protein SEA_BILO_52 [Streptomyces phage Bilo]|nr:hypothetical protein SEA_BILO_52 [Streptomyces phage Bilo]
MSDTPIFDQLARELGYDRMIAGGPTLRLRPSAFRTVGQTDKSVNAAPAPAIQGVDDEEVVYIKPIPVTTLAELAKGTHQE